MPPSLLTLKCSKPEDPPLNRPLETTFWMRFSQFMKGFFLYNTIYWKRASDDLNIRRMSREERANLRPKRDLEIIRPRERARAHDTRSLLSLPGEYSEPAAPEPAPPVKVPARTVGGIDAIEDGVGVEIHRRKKHRSSRHSKVIPKKYLTSDGGVLGWLFKK